MVVVTIAEVAKLRDKWVTGEKGSRLLKIHSSISNYTLTPWQSMLS